MGGATLTFREVVKRYDETVAVHNVSLSVPPGQFCVLLGSSGAGKSTLLKMVNGITRPTSGRIYFNETEVCPRALHHIQPSIGMVHQSFHLIPRLSVLDNVLAGSLARTSIFSAMLGLFPREREQKACQLLSRVGLGETHLYRRAQDLSGGQQQRVAIARALILDPPLLLADEPVASLDPATSIEVLTLLREAARERGATVLCSLHQVDLARAFADRIVGMRGGEITFDDTPARFNATNEYEVYRPFPNAAPLELRLTEASA